MLLSALLPLLPFFLAATVSAQEVDNGDVPQQCRAVCANTVAAAARCDDQFSDDDAGEVNCICTSSNAATEIPNCEACVSQAENSGDDDDSDNDFIDLVQSCNFVRQTTYTMAGMSATATATGTSATATSGSNGNNDNCDPGDDGDDDCTSSAVGGGAAATSASNTSAATMITVTQTQTSGSAQATQTSVNGGDVDEDGEDGSAANSGSTTNGGAGTNAATGMGVPALAVGGAIMLAAAALL